MDLSKNTLQLKLYHGWYYFHCRHLWQRKHNMQVKGYRLILPKFTWANTEILTWTVLYPLGAIQQVKSLIRCKDIRLSCFYGNDLSLNARLTLLITYNFGEEGDTNENQQRNMCLHVTQKCGWSMLGDERRTKDWKCFSGFLCIP